MAQEAADINHIAQQIKTPQQLSYANPVVL